MSDKICGCAGCTTDAIAKIRTDDYGTRVVCDRHVIAGTVVTRYDR